jgi:Mg-chelatase subunit ChlD
LLAACGGGADEAVEDTSETDTSAVDDTTDSEVIEDNGVEATGSEADSGELPPTPDSGGKVDTVRATPNAIANEDTAVISASPPTDRIDSSLPSASRQLDIVFLLDATGSMADELDTLKAGLGNIAALTSLPDSIALRYSFVVYRDQGKSDTGQLLELTDDWVLFARDLMTVTAVGGGDYPENLNEGLYQAITQTDWNPGADRLIILLGDAPPHQNLPGAIPYEESVSLGVEQNITIFTVGSDGLNESGVTIYQQIAQASNGRFIYISNYPENAQINATSVQPMSHLPAIIVDIVLEVLNADTP